MDAHSTQLVKKVGTMCDARPIPAAGAFHNEEWLDEIPLPNGALIQLRSSIEVLFSEFEDQWVLTTASPLIFCGIGTTKEEALVSLGIDVARNLQALRRAQKGNQSCPRLEECTRPKPGCSIQWKDQTKAWDEFFGGVVVTPIEEVISDTLFDRCYRR